MTKRSVDRPDPAQPFKHLVPGHRYNVVQAFVDFDQVEHPVGEVWTFRRATFLPYDDGLSLFVTFPDGQDQQIRLQWRQEAQGAIIDALETYVSSQARDD